MSYRQTLRELAFDSHGVVTVADAAERGVPAVELRKLASRGALQRISQGVYRMLEAPTTELSEFAEAVAATGCTEAVLVDEAVLAAHGLAQVNLRTIKVGVPRRTRTQVPATVEIIQRIVPDDDRDFIEGIPAMTIPAAIRATKGRILRERLVDAARQAEARDLISEADRDDLIKELTDQ